MARYVLDTFAPYAYFTGEPASSRVERLLRQAEAGEHELSMPMFNVGELIYKLWKLGGQERSSAALQIVEQWPVRLVQADRDLVLRAAALKAQRRMGYLDCFPTALAMRLNAAVVTGDSGFEAVRDIVPVHWLPRP